MCLCSNPHPKGFKQRNPASVPTVVPILRFCCVFAAVSEEVTSVLKASAAKKKGRSARRAAARGGDAAGAGAAGGATAGAADEADD